MVISVRNVIGINQNLSDRMSENRVWVDGPHPCTVVRDR